ncbi:hypothetical protein OGA32_000110 [Salmonella enterica]|nr:hypothetical protein [Salmonella enterica]
MIINITPEKEEVIKPILSQRYNAASDYMEASYKQDARKWWDFYNGALPKPALDSMVPALDRTCYTITENCLKDLIEIFTSGEDVVSFAPLNNEDAYTAKAATQLVNQIFLRDNNGKSLLQDALKTSLVEGSAIIKYYFSDDEITTHTVHEENLPNREEILQYLLGLREAGIEFKDEDAELIQNKDGTFNITLTYTQRRERVKVELLPIEEFVIEPGTKSIPDSSYMVHRVLKSKEQLKYLGLTDDELSEINDDESDLSAWTVNAARSAYRTNLDDDKGDDSDDPSFRVWVKEHYIKTGMLSDDGSVRLYQIVQIGEGKIVSVTEVFNFPFVVFSPIPTPNNVLSSCSLVGSVADIQCDLAWAKQSLHTYAHKANFPNYFGVDKEFDERALMNPKPATVFKVKTLQSLSLAPLPALPPVDSIFALADKEKEERTGINSGVSGLASNGIETNRSSEATVNNMITLATGRVRQYAHSIANGGYSELFKGIYNLYKDNSSRAIPVLTAYGIQPIHPSQLVDRDHLLINIALTTAEKEKKGAKVNMLLDFIAKVESIQSAFVQLPHKAWLINEYGSSLGYPNVFDYTAPINQIQPSQPDPMTIAQLENIQANTAYQQAQAQKLIGDDHHQNEKLLFEQQLAAKKEAREDLKLKFEMSHSVDELNLAGNELAVRANVEAMKSQHNTSRQAIEEYKAKTANLKVQGEIIQKSKETPKVITETTK